jgi:acetate kinase
MTSAVLALNAGSSSIKFALFEAAHLSLISTGQIESDGTTQRFTAHDAAGATLAQTSWPDADEDEQAGHERVLETLLTWVEARLGPTRLSAAGHRVVHGGREFLAPVRLTPGIVEALDRLTPLAPLHQQRSLGPIRALSAIRPALAQVACFDTAFHHTMPPVAARFALPRAFEDEGVRRYGFHGLSYEYIARSLRRAAPHLAAGRVIVAHLGNGASLCAMQNGVSIDTTMSFTALDGLVMGTRCGTLDPGVLLYMLQQQGLPPLAVQHILYEQSGLLGVSGISGDMRVLLESGEPHAKEAIELFVYRVARETAALTASLGGLDGFVFTAGIGEHAPQIRSLVCARLGWLGMAPGGSVDVRVMATDEEAMIATHTLECMALLPA